MATSTDTGARSWLGLWHGVLEARVLHGRPGELAKMAAAFFEIGDMFRAWAATHGSQEG